MRRHPPRHTRRRSPDLEPRHPRRRQIRALLVAAAAALPHVAEAAAQQVTYRVEFEGNWTTLSTPGGVVGGAHFTTLIGAVHSGDVTFWSSGSMASAGVENVAELGSVGLFRSEVQASPHTRSVIQEGVSGGGTGSSTFTITVTPSHPRVTLLSMIGPSPDWFVGVSGVSLRDGPDNWRDEHVVNLYPYDAGTEDGTEFTLSNPATSPQGVIRSIRGEGKFSHVRMARLTFTRLTFDPVASFATESSSAAEDAGTRNVTVKLSPGPGAGLTLRYSLSGTATAESDYAIAGAAGSSGTLAVSPGRTSVSLPVAITDDSAEEGPETVVLTLTRGAGYTVGTPAMHTLTITDNDRTAPPGVPSVSLSASPNPVGEGRPVTVTAQLSGALETDVTIPLALTPGTAEPGDYGPLAGIAVAAGATRGTGTVTTAVDADGDDETFTVALGTLPPEVTAGAPSSVTVRIADADGPGPTDNRPPAFTAPSYVFELEEGAAGPVELGRVEAEDPEGEALAYALARGDRERFAVGAADGAVSYLGEGEDFETDPAGYRLTVLARDGSGGEARAEVQIRITDVNEAPTANRDSARTREDEPVVIGVLANDTDPEADALRVESVSEPSHGAARITPDGRVEYTPDADFHGTDGFSYVVADEGGRTATGEVEVTVVAANDPPAAVGTIPDQALEAGGGAVTVDLAAYFEDADGEALAFRAVSSDTAVVGSAVEGAGLTLTPVSAGSATVTVSAEDAAGEAAMQAFGVVVGRNRMERVVLEETLAAMARSQLAGARMAVGRRVRGERSGGGPDALVMGRAVPAGREEAWAGLRGAAERWLSARAPLPPGNGEGPGGRPMLPGPGSGAAGAPSPRAAPAPWPGPAAGSGIAGGPEALFRDTGFELAWGAREGAGGRRWALWGEGDVQTFAGAASRTTGYDGEVRTGYAGIDTELTERWLVGAAVSRSRGGGDWRAGAGSGRLESTLTTAQPYARWSNGTTSVWMLAGAGRGELENVAGRADRSVSGLDLRLGLIEFRRRVGTAGGMELGLRADAGWAELASGEGAGPADGLAAAVNQARMGADVSRTMRAGAFVLEPFGEAHLRRDGGAGQTGNGLEVAGGLRAVAGRVRIDAQGRLLAVHSAEGYRERGAGLSLAVGGDGGEGLSLAVSSHWGDAAAGTGALWEGGGLHGRGLPGPGSGAWTMDARGSYGYRLGSRLLSWFGSVGRSTGEPRLTVGGRFGGGNR